MKGIILAGGSGTRLYPLTKVTSKQLLPVFDKPMIYYPLSTLMLANIKDILIISTPHDIPRIKDLLGDGNQFGINIQYKVQHQPNGLAEAFIIGEEFIGNDNVTMILGDNIYYGNGLSNVLKTASENTYKGISTVFGYAVSDPKRFGIVEFDKDNKVISVEEKPHNPKSNYAITGIYFYTNDVVKYAKSVKPSKRGEIEITDINQIYLDKGKLNVTLLGRGFAWMDAGTISSLSKSSNFIKLVQEQQNMLLSAPEEIAYVNGWINEEQLLMLGEELSKTEYGQYLIKRAKGEIRT